MMATVDPTTLWFGPYRTPRFRYGQGVMCEIRGEVVITRLRGGRIQWPMGQKPGQRAVGVIIFADLARALREEAATAICHWWGVDTQTVTKWRKALGIGPTTRGTSELRRRQAQTPAVKAGLRKAHAKARDPERRAKIAAARRGKSRPREVMEPAWAANRQRRVSNATRWKMSEAHRRRGTRPPAAGQPWTQEEEKLLQTLPAPEVAKRTGRTLTAVYCRRQKLRLPDGRSASITLPARQS